jgi:hypothetical protein
MNMNMNTNTDDIGTIDVYICFVRIRTAIFRRRVTRGVCPIRTPTVPTRTTPKYIFMQSIHLYIHNIYVPPDDDGTLNI